MEKEAKKTDHTVTHASPKREDKGKSMGIADKGGEMTPAMFMTSQQWKDVFAEIEDVQTPHSEYYSMRGTRNPR